MDQVHRSMGIAAMRRSQRPSGWIRQERAASEQLTVLDLALVYIGAEASHVDCSDHKFERSRPQTSGNGTGRVTFSPGHRVPSSST